MIDKAIILSTNALITFDEILSYKNNLYNTAIDLFTNLSATDEGNEILINIIDANLRNRFLEQEMDLDCDNIGDGLFLDAIEVESGEIKFHYQYDNVSVSENITETDIHVLVDVIRYIHKELKKI